MNKTTTLMCAVCTMLSVTATARDFRIVPSSAIDVPTFQQTLAARFNNGPQALRNASPQNDGIITEAPAGDSRIYTLKSFSFYVAMGSYVGYEEIETAREAVITDDAVYFQGPLGAYDKKTFMKAVKKDESSYTVSLPCPIYTETFRDWETQEDVTVNYELRLMDAVPNEEGEIIRYVPSDEAEMTITLSDGIFSLDLGYEPTYDKEGKPSYPEKILGLCADNGNWAGYGDAGFDWVPFDEQVATPPADMTIENWTLASNDKGVPVRLGFHGDEVWIGDLEPKYIPNAWVKGKIDNDKITVESGQFLGIIESQFVYYVSGIVNGYIGTSVADNFTFKYDPENKIIKADNPDMLMSISAYPDAVVSWVQWQNPSFAFQPESIDPAPQNPFNLKFDDWFEQYDYATFSFDESNMNARGQLLDTSAMYFHILFDGEPEEFGYYEYEGDFPEPTTDIPFNQSSGNFFSWDITHQMMVYTQGLETIGVQVFNTVDGKTYSSDIITLDLTSGDVTVGVNGIAADRGVDHVEYYTIDGHKVTNPSDGIFICKATMTDGSVKTYKRTF